MYNLKRFSMVALLLLAAAAAATGCGAGEKAVEKAMETAIEESTGVKVDQKNDAVTITTKDGSMSIGGESNKLPEGFPLPAFPNAKIESSMTTTENGAKHYVVSLSSKKEIKELAAYYEDALKAKNIQPEKTEIKDESASSVFLNGKAGKLEATVQIYTGDSIGVEGNVINIIAKQSE